MCRWFAYVSPAEPTLLADILLTPANAITKQCSEHYLPFLLPHGKSRDLRDSEDKLLRMRNSLMNMDGVGIAWYTSSSSAYTAKKEGLRPSLYKSQSPPTNDFNFKSLCENTESTCVMAHIRASSGSAVVPVNCHPFVFGRHTFMHNGVISRWSRIAREVSTRLNFDTYENIRGSTDSEHAAALYMTYLTGATSTKETWEQTYPLSEMKTALQKTIITIMEIQSGLLGPDALPNSLNFCVTDGHKLVACRFRNHATEQPPSLYWSDTAGKTLNRKYPGHPDGPDVVNSESIYDNAREHGTHVIVASEPTTYVKKEWHLIEKNNLLCVDEDGSQSSVSMEYDPALNFGEVQPTSSSTATMFGGLFSRHS